MSHFLLDTNIAIHVMKRRPPLALERFNLHACPMALWAITLSELPHGTERSSAPESFLEVVEDFCSSCFCSHLGGAAVDRGGPAQG